MEISVPDFVQNTVQTEFVSVIELTTPPQKIQLQAMPALIAMSQRISPIDQVTAFQPANNDWQQGDAIGLMIQGRPAARLDYVRTETGVRIDGFIVMMWLPDDYDLRLTAEVVDAPLALVALEAIVFELLDSVTFTAFGPGLPPLGWSTYFETG